MKRTPSYMTKTAANSKGRIKRLLSIVLILWASSAHAQFATSSVMKEGKWHALMIAETGMYKITYAMLEDLGYNPQSLNPQQLKIYGFGGGMLSQANSAQKFADISENAIWVKGEADGRFDTDDYLIFYAEGPNAITINEESGLLAHQQNDYAESAYYYLCLSEGVGKRIAFVPSIANPEQSFDYFDDLLYAEPDEVNLLQSGREWFSSPYGVTTEKKIRFEAEGVVAGAKGLMTFRGIGRSELGCGFRLALNGNEVGTVGFPGIFITRYGTWGIVQEQQFEAVLPNSSTLEVTTDFQKQKNSDLGYLDYLRLQVPRKLSLYGKQTIFRTLATAQINTAGFTIANMPAAAKVWNVSNPQMPQEHTLTFSGTNASFAIANNRNVPTCIAFDPTALPLPTVEKAVANQDLHALQPTNLLIITVEAFKAEAERLAAFRQSNDGLTAQVVLLSEIYREFSSGMVDVTAIRDFIRMLYLRSVEGGGEELRYVLLFGDASYDYKNRLPNNTNIVPVYQSVNSIDPLATYSSDDYFGFMEDGEGDWAEIGNTSSHTLELGVGRLPAKNATEAKILVDKLIHYENDVACMGNWRQRLTFTADDGDLGTHQKDADSLARMVERLYPNYHAKRIFVDAYEQINEGNGRRSPAAKAALVNAIEDGALVVNFTGHGSETGWTSEAIMDNPTAQRLVHYNQLPLFVTATCEFGRYDDPVRDSGAELLFKNSEGGAIGLLTTTRPVLSFSNFRINKAFYDALFEPIDGEMPRLGDILKSTKNRSINGVNNRNFALLGDPSMRLAYPQNEVAITQINGKTAHIGDTLQALMPVTLSGEVWNNGALDNSFDGEVSAVVYDRPARLQTRGDEAENIKLNYQAFEHVLYRGTARVSNGRFSFDFVVPKDIAYDYGLGKVQLYARHDTELRDAQGSLALRIGGTADAPIDDTPPVVEAWLENLDFKPNGEVSRYPFVIVRASDASGINIAGQAIGHDLQASIDGEAISYTYLLNDYFTPLEGRFDEGWAYFQVPDQLSPGAHELRVQAFDTHNNSTEIVIPFVVKQAITLDFHQNRPNPFSEGTTFSFTHDRAGDDISAIIHLYNAQGKLVVALARNFYSSEASIELAWDGKDGVLQNLQEGFYIAQLQVQSLNDGEATKAVIKMVVIR